MTSYQQHLSIKTWAEEDRPREKLELKGRQSLTDAELIAILIATGNKEESAVGLSRRILLEANNDLNQLARYSIKDFNRFKGIGDAKAISIIAALEIGRRRKEHNSIEMTKVLSSADAYRLIYPYFADLQHEEFWIILLNRSNKLISISPISKGGVSGTVADPKIVFKIALEKLASSIILCHNHPSGSIKPSDADIALTKKMSAAGSLLDIVVADHVIAGDKDFYSFADEGMMA